MSTTKRLTPLRIWRVFGRGLKAYARLAGDHPEREQPYPEMGTVTARTEAEAIARVVYQRVGVFDSDADEEPT